MFTAAEGRGRGVAAALLRALEDTAREEKLPELRLETGEALDAACRLYERHGFTRCGAFGGYEENGCSVFMQKPLS
jgi:putative acetyltransferase